MPVYLLIGSVDLSMVDVIHDPCQFFGSSTNRIKNNDLEGSSSRTVVPESVVRWCIKPTIVKLATSNSAVRSYQAPVYSRI